MPKQLRTMKSQSNKPHLIAEVFCDESDRRYRVTEITVWITTGRRWSSNRLFKCRWQSSAGHTGWYGAEVTIQLDAGCLGEYLPKVTKLFAKHPLTNDPKAWLESTKIPVLVFDQRADEFVAPERVLGHDYFRWMARGPDGKCAAAAVATEDGAEAALMRAFAANIADGWGSSMHAEQLEYWIANGKVAERDRWTRPVVPDLDRAFSSLGDEHRARVEEEQARILEQQEAEAEAAQLANAVEA